MGELVIGDDDAEHECKEQNHFDDQIQEIGFLPNDEQESEEKG